MGPVGREARKLNVLLTIDTEFYPISARRGAGAPDADIARDIYGLVSDREVGLRYQLESFARHGLKAVFMVEALCASAPEIGAAPLKEMTALIASRGHEIQLHVHPEWVERIPSLAPDLGRVPLLTSLAEGDQLRVIGLALENLQGCAPAPVLAFRAGDFAADESTLRAVARLGLRFDTSYNSCYLARTCKLAAIAPHRLAQPIETHGIREVPISYFQDYPGHLRHAQLGACSSRELRRALNEAHARGWSSFVIVSHTFELLKDRWHARRPPAVRERVVRRFEALCSFLAAHRDRFRCVGFADLDEGQPGSRAPAPALRGHPIWTAGRICEQVLERLNL